jgi:RimJ/RimL family protein N-acetyltransferase
LEHELAVRREGKAKYEATPLSFQFSAMTVKAAHAIALWAYPPPYTLYNHEAEHRPAAVRSMLDATNQFMTITNSTGDRVGFCYFGNNAQVRGGCYERPAIDIGMGMRSNLTGKGHGKDLVEAVLNYTIGCPPDSRMRVTIAEFNTRAQRVWEKAGLQEESTFVRASDGVAFRVMARPPE